MSADRMTTEKLIAAGRSPLEILLLPEGMRLANRVARNNRLDAEILGLIYRWRPELRNRFNELIQEIIDDPSTAI